ncbi:tail fiber assembly protein [Enterobacter asburiae]|uniref:tail fiber assembly protein n=1 Tax=Enterobacter asburiae TaxID=61645 RepID=UPI003F557039
MEERYFYSPTTGGFYPLTMKEQYENSINGWPVDAIEVSTEDYRALMDGQENGQVITPDANGKPVLTDPVVDPVVVAEGTKRQLLKEAAEKIAILQDAVDLNMATEDEKFLLIEWKKYRVLLTRIKPEDAPNIEWPVKPGETTRQPQAVVKQRVSKAARR